MSEDKKKDFLDGIDDCITKPMDEGMLLCIKAHLRCTKIVNERKSESGDVILNYDTFSVFLPKE